MRLKDQELNLSRQEHNKIEEFRNFIYDNVDEIFLDDSITAISGILLEKLDELQAIYFETIKAKEQELINPVVEKPKQKRKSKTA